MKKLLVVLLAVAILLPTLLASCNTDTPQATTPAETTPNATTPQATTPQATTPEQTTPPEQPPIDVPYDGPDITSDNVLKRADIITLGTTESELYAAEELAKYLGMKKIEVKEGAFPITLSIDSTLGDDAFKINATLSGDGAGMTIVGGNERGVLYGVYKFLEELGGVRYFTPDLETVPTTDLTLKEGLILEYTPYFESRRLNWNSVRAEADWCTKQGVNAHDGSTDAKYGGLQTYGSGLFVHTLGALTETGDGLSPNPCLSLDSPEGQKNFQTTLKICVRLLKNNPQ